MAPYSLDDIVRSLLLGFESLTPLNAWAAFKTEGKKCSQKILYVIQVVERCTEWESRASPDRSSRGLYRCREAL